MTESRQVEILLNRSFEIVQSGSKQVTRSASSDSHSVDVLTNVFGAPAFICFASIPGSSPQFSFPVPYYLFASGLQTKQLRALYDPDVSVIRFFVESSGSGIDPLFSTADTYDFTYYLLREKSQ